MQRKPISPNQYKERKLSLMGMHFQVCTVHRMGKADLQSKYDPRFLKLQTNIKVILSMIKTFGVLCERKHKTSPQGLEDPRM